MLHVAVEKIEVGAAAVEIGVHIVLLRTSGQLAVVKKIHHPGWVRNRSKSDGAVVFAGLVNVLVNAKFKKVVSVSAPRI